MMKHLILIPFLLLAVSGCKEMEEISDRGGCTGGSCNSPNGPSFKPASCNGSTKLNQYQNETFHTDESHSGGVTYIAQMQFGNNNATLTQYCVVGNDSVSPYVTGNVEYNPVLKTVSFDSVNPNTSQIGKVSCKAQFDKDKWKVSYQGNCLVLTNGNQVRYWQRGGL